MHDRVILHCDCNAFFASVECLLRPELDLTPMAVCGDPESRHGIILAKNEKAKRFGIQTAETIWSAQKKCPGLVLVPPHRAEYEHYSRLTNEIYRRYTDLVEPFGIDESWLDVTGSQSLFGDGVTIANAIRAAVREELGLTISVGVSFNKAFAKLGSDYKKPDATTVFSRENFEQLVYPLPVSDLLFVGKSARAVLEGLYIRTIGDLAHSDRELIARKLGKLGEQIHDYACGLDDSPVRSADEEREIKSVGNSMTFRRNLTGLPDIRIGVTALADSVAGRMRKYGVKCRTVQVTIRDPEFKQITRQRPMEIPTHLAKELTEACMELIQAAWDLRAPIRMLAITGSNLVEDTGEPQQLSLFDKAEDGEKRAKQEKLEAAMDRIRGKFGHGAIGPAGVLGNDLGIEEDGQHKKD